MRRRDSERCCVGARREARRSLLCCARGFQRGRTRSNSAREQALQRACKRWQTQPLRNFVFPTYFSSPQHKICLAKFKRTLSGHWLPTCIPRDPDSVHLVNPWLQQAAAVQGLAGAFISCTHTFSTSDLVVSRGKHRVHLFSCSRKHPGLPPSPSCQAFSLQTLCHSVAENGAGSVQPAMLLGDAREHSALPVRAKTCKSSATSPQGAT